MEPEQEPELPRYISYLLRLWQVRDGEGLVWRALLERPGSGERLGFASVDELFAYLATEIGHPIDK